jgi:hypothetical protein
MVMWMFFSSALLAMLILALWPEPHRARGSRAADLRVHRALAPAGRNRRCRGRDRRPVATVGRIADRAHGTAIAERTAGRQAPADATTAIRTGVEP